jgi:hypothetical protein
MAPEEQQTTQPLPQDSPVMLGALAILAYAASMMTHEALGHGGYCIVMGGHNVMLTGWGEGCSTHPPGIEAAGPGTQFVGGLLAWLVLHYLPHGTARLRYFFWLYMVFTLFVSSSYVSFSGVTDIGDAAAVISGLKAHVVWRGVLILLGAGFYFLSMLATAFEFKRLIGVEDGIRQLRRLVWIPYVSAGVFACCAGALNRTMTTGSLNTMGRGTALVWAGASSFGSGLGKLWLPDIQRGMTLKTVTPGVYLNWSASWVVAAAIVVAAFFLFIGPGLK